MKNIGIVTFGFGRISPNQIIAHIASRQARAFNACVYAQLGVRFESDIVADYTYETPGKPPPTLRIARGAVQWAKQHGLNELLIVAAKPHLWRCERSHKSNSRS